MTFKPADDVLEDMANGQNSQTGTSQYTYDNNYGGAPVDGQQVFQQSQNTGNEGMFQGNYEDTGSETVSQVLDIPVEEVKAPDLSQLLEKSGGQDIQDNASTDVAQISDTQINAENAQSSVESTQISTDNSVNNTETVANQQQVAAQPQELQQGKFEFVDPDKLPDSERTAMVLGIEGAVSSNLDFLVNEQWAKAIAKYKKIHRILFRWGFSIIIAVIGLTLGVFAQTKMDQPNNYGLINDNSIKNIKNWKNETPDIILKSVIDSGADLEVAIPYGTANTGSNSESFQSRNNLIKYRGIVLPQTAVINGSGEFISLQDFSEGKIARKDLENLVKILVKNSSVRSALAKNNIKWSPIRFNEGGLVDGFSLRCVDNNKVSDFLCDKYLQSFYKYGKYYDLSSSQYSAEVLSLLGNLKSQGKDIEPICKMITEYTLHVGKVSNNFEYIMQNCREDEYEFYKRLVNFIELEKSLGQPELSDRIFDDSELNAYKLLSAQQTIYKTTLNEIYIKSYLNFVQALLNKDNKTNRYIDPIYKDLLYVFNADELYQKVMEAGKTELKMQIDQINNGNAAYKYPGLLSQLTTTDIIKSTTDFSGSEVEDITIENIFSQYYGMKDRLKIRSVNKVSDNELVVKTEFFTNKIFSVTNNKTLKLTLSLYRKGNVLYVSNIKVANQAKLTDILNIQVANGDTSFNSMLGIIDEQVGMWYNPNPEKEEQQQTVCDLLQEIKDISIYTCDDSSISLYKGEIEYNFELVNGVLNSFTIGDEELENMLKDKLKSVMLIKDNTPTIITSIVNFTVETKDDNLEEKLEVVNQFRIHFKIVPTNVEVIEGTTGEYLVSFNLGKFKLQAHYNTKTHLLTKISYVDCDKTLEIRQLELAITTENEDQLTEITNNPQAFFATVNPAAYKKYQRMCE